MLKFLIVRNLSPRSLEGVINIRLPEILTEVILEMLIQGAIYLIVILLSSILKVRKELKRRIRKKRGA